MSNHQDRRRRTAASHARTSRAGSAGRHSRGTSVRTSRTAGATIGNVGAGAGANGQRGQRGRGRGGASNSETLISRRTLLYGAAGVGVAAVAIGGGVAAYSAYKASQESSEITYLEVPESAVTSLSDFEVVDDYNEYFSLTATIDMSLGTLVWCNSNDVAACLVPTDTGSPLTNVVLLPLGSATPTTVLDQAVGAAEGFEIYDVRATMSGLIWTEANILDGQWRIYTATLNQLVMGTPTLVDSADETFETPTIAAVDSYAFWQVMPSTYTYENAEEIPESQLKRAPFGSSRAEVVYSNARRFGTPLYACEDGVVITARADSRTVYYMLTKFNASSGEMVDQLTLPQGMAPLEAGYGKTGFMWSFEKIYSYGDGIANMGTYLPMKKPSAYNYDNIDWFCFGRTPTAAPAWCGDLLVVKSSYSVCGIDLADKAYCAIDVDNGADDYGEYLASTGTHNRIVTFTSIDYQPVNEAAVQACRIKVWA